MTTDQELVTQPSSSRAARAWPAVAARLRGHGWLALLFALPALLALFAPGYFIKAHDARHSIFFLIEFDQVFKEGVLWPVWGPDHAVGFGYPVWLVYAPMAYIVAEAFHLLGLGYAAAVKATWALGFVLGATGTYRLARRWWGAGAALVASVAFTYAPYHLVQIYVRAALAEFMALAWLPWVLLSLVSLWDDPRPARAGLAALATSALLLTHTVSTLSYVPLLAGFLLVMLIRDARAARLERAAQGELARSASTGAPAKSDAPAELAQSRRIWRSLGWTAVALALGGLLSAIFFLPLVFERRYIMEAQWVASTYDYRNHFVYFSQFFDPAWGFGYSVPGTGDGMSFQLGILIAVLAAVGGLAALRVRDRGLPRRSEALFLLLTSLAALFTMTPAAAPLWQALPFISLVQFPWRLLAVTIFTFSLLTAVAVRWLDGKVAPPRLASTYPYLFSLALVIASLPYTQPQLYPLRPEDEQPVAVLDFELQFPDMRGMTVWSERLPTDQDSPLISQYLAGEPLQRAAVSSGNATITGQESHAVSASATVVADGPARVRFYTYYFPGWRATVDGQPALITPEPPNGLISIDVPPGKHEVAVRFGATPVRSLGAALSLVALCAVIILFLAGRIWRKRERMLDFSKI
jgi:hypothetical protein